MDLEIVFTRLKDYRLYVKYLILFFAACFVRRVFEYLYTLNTPRETSSVELAAQNTDTPLFEDKTAPGEDTVTNGNYFYSKYLGDITSDDNQPIPFSLPRYDSADMLERARSFYHSVNQRRSCRYFSSDPVPREVIEQCILAAGTSPSGAHTEPWHFVVVCAAEERRLIREIVEEEERVNYERRMGRSWLQDIARIKTSYVKEYISDAPFVILVFKEPYHIREGVKHNNWYYEASVSISVGILLCALNNVGLVTVTSTPMNCGPAIRRLLNRPEHEKLAFLLPVGYPSSTATVPDLKRKQLSQISTFIG